MAKTITLGNNPQSPWLKGLEEIPLIQVPNIPSNKESELTEYVNTLPKDVELMIIDADSLNAENTELPLSIALYVRLMLHSCLKTSLCHILIVTNFGINIYKEYGARSVLLMTQKTNIIELAETPNIRDVIAQSSPLTPSEYMEGFLNLIKIVPQEKIEGRHSIANEWGAEALYKVISNGVKSNIISSKATSSLYFKYSAIASLNAEDIKRIVEGRVPQFLTNRVCITEKVKYLIIDDEAQKGWDKVMAYMLPNAEQEVWNLPINTYDDISEDIRHKISEGYYDLIFLDLRMAGVAEENILKPEDFSGMKILKAIKKVNKGIQVIMLTATNKAWNLKALIDAGANGYYMKESPEYHFSLKYSEQNAHALIETIKECLGNSYLQFIVAQQKNLDLPSDSELSDNIKNQLSIALSLILKAKSESEYAFAYISLEQVFEIASKYLIRQESRGKIIDYYFTEDTEDRCYLFNNGVQQGYLTSDKGAAPIAQWKIIAAIYYQLYGGKEKDFGAKVQSLIHLRNEYIHPDNGAKPTITRENFINLFNTIVDFLAVFK